MHVVYVSPSILPSRAANSIHVLRQCNALAKVVENVTLVASTAQSQMKLETLRDYYGFDLEQRLSLETLHFKRPRALNLRIALTAVKYIFTGKDCVIISRNLYFSALCRLFNRDHVYETHLVETGWRALLQRFIIMRQTSNVVISDALRDILGEAFGIGLERFVVLHDAASEAERVDVSDLLAAQQVTPRPKIGYFGHLYEGRGIEIVLDIAEQRPDCDVYIVGGEPVLVAQFKAKNLPANAHFLGFQRNSVARSMMRQMDVLLMPYQRKVSIGLAGSDTSRWMSPLKMFEYMSSEVAILSSDLPVLREVLRDGESALMVPPDDRHAWRAALARLLADASLRQRLSATARRIFEERYTWEKRAQSLLTCHQRR